MIFSLEFIQNENLKINTKNNIAIDVEKQII